jgi:hypothetical protein
VLSSARAERSVDVWVGAGRGEAGGAAVTVAWTPRAAAGHGDAAARNVSVVVKGAGGDRSFDAALDAGSLSFPSPPGTLQLQTTIRDAQGNILDEDRRPFVVPDFSGGSLAIGAPLVLRARTAAEARALGGMLQVTPFAGRDFIRTDRLFVRFAIYGTAASDAEVSARLTNKAGAALLDLPVTRRTATDTEYQLELPLASIARGDYLIAVAAAHGEERTRALVPVRVVPY